MRKNICEPISYKEQTKINIFGKEYNVLDLTRELSDKIPVYPGHAKTSQWWHLTHEECVMRLGDTPFEGYAVKGLVTSDHVSTHVDAIYHFNKHRPDLTIEKFPVEHMFTSAVWIDVSYVGPGKHIELEDIKNGLAAAGETIKPGDTLMYYTGISEKWNNAEAFVTEYPGLSGKATDWILDQGVINVCTDAISTDLPGDITYPNHTRHGERLVVHTELIANMNKIPLHRFQFIMTPLKLVNGTGCPVRALALWE
ncbi:cyclase family protein [Bacillus sp. JJ1533]|uniref:cyclase family protein n=1 Tax=Bacillus sp. JJ1533 TaxID=3122959 RepID=UPI0030001B8A